MGRYISKMVGERQKKAFKCTVVEGRGISRRLRYLVEKVKMLKKNERR
jgi:hypothetical protein